MKNAALENLRHDRDALVQELERSGAKIIGAKVLCPWHEDRNPSGSIFKGEDGAWRFKCFACQVSGDVFDLQARRESRDVADVLGDMAGNVGNPSSWPVAAEKPRVLTFPSLAAFKAHTWRGKTLEAVYEYTHPQSGAIELLVARYCKDSGGKDFYQLRPCAAGAGFEMLAPEKPWPIYNRARLAGADVVVVVEGEKCVEALHGVGLVATTSPGGAGKAAYADWRPLAGKSVYLWPDNDDPGRKHMADAAAVLEKLAPAPRLYLVEPEREYPIEPKWDAADFIEALGERPPEEKRRFVEDLLKTARPLGASGELRQVLEKTFSGQWRDIALPWPAISRLSRPLLPESITILAGGPGATKSFLLLQAAIHWHKAGVPFAVYLLEESRSFHLARVLALESGESRLLDDGWLRQNPDCARALFEEHQPFLDAFGKCIWTPGDGVSLEYPALAKWVDDRAANGIRVIGIDPLTMAECGRMKPWEAAAVFMQRTKRALATYGASAVLVSHPTKLGQGRELADLAGGAAFSRFASTVLWLDRFEEKTGQVIRADGAAQTAIWNRTVRIVKTRNGRGTGVRVALFFDPHTLRSAEKGVMVQGREHTKTKGMEL